MVGARPLVLASPNHPIAICVYGAFTIAGLAHILDISLTPAMLDLMPPLLVQIWGFTLFISGSTCLLSAWRASTSRGRPERPILAEGLSSVTLSVLIGVYSVATLRYRGIDPQYVIGQVIYASLALGTLARFVQIDIELMRLKKARATPLLADPPPIGDPTTTE